MATVNPVLRTHRTDGSGRCLIYLRLEAQGERRYISLGLKLRPTQWKENYSRKPVRKSFKRHDEYNAIIAQRIAEAEHVLNRKKWDGVELTAREWKDLLQQDPEGFWPFADAWLEDRKREGQIHYWRRCRAVLRKFREITGDSLTWDQFTPELLRRFDAWMRDERGNAPNTRRGAFRVIRTITRQAMKARLLNRDSDPFLRFDRPKRVESRKVTLSQDEIRQLEAAGPFQSELEQMAHDVFLMAYYMRGARFTDVITLRNSDVSGGRINYVMSKNGKATTVPVTDKVAAIMKRYEGVTEEYIFPPLDGRTFSDDVRRVQFISSVNAHLNKTLKKVVAKAGIEKSVSMHVARHSFAFNAKRAGVDHHVIQTALKHTNAKTTDVYLRELDDSDLDDALSDVIK